MFKLFHLFPDVCCKHFDLDPSIKKNLISGSLLCRDGYKLVFESNKCILSKYGTFVGKDYESGGLFRLSLTDTCVKSVNNVSCDVESNVWHSRLCHINFGCMTRLASLNLIPKIDLVKGSKCHAYVQSKQPRKPHKVMEARDLAPLELFHSNFVRNECRVDQRWQKIFYDIHR